MYRAYHRGILGQIATRSGAFAEARALLSEALAETLATRLWPRAALVLYQVGLLRFAEAEHENDAAALAEGVQVMAAVAHHRATWQVLRARAQRQIDERRRQLPQLVAEDAISSGRRLDWSSDLEQLMGDLSRAARAS